MTPIAASRVQAMAGIFHPFVSLCFHCKLSLIAIYMYIMLIDTSCVGYQKIAF